MKNKLLLIWGMLLLTWACTSTALNPHLQTVVSGREEPTILRLSPDHCKMLYKARGGYYVLDLDTGKKVDLFDLNKDIGYSVGWVDNRYLYSRARGTFWLEYPRLVVDTKTWEVRDIRELPAAERTRIEAGWAQHLYGEPFLDSAPHYAPNGQYYFRATSQGMYDRTIVLYTAAEQELITYQGFISNAVWAHDSSGVYLLLSKMAVVELGATGGSIVKLLVPRR